ncbi:MAG: hypothetical protein KBA82_03700 [Nitrosomonas sp.]|jgi:S-formylglutathione hydrolase|nr:hypothetical protein [Nitrosomonas sp.]MBP7112076.1 hypothetical protein [Nitrosomonas sp.]
MEQIADRTPRLFWWPGEGVYRHQSETLGCAMSFSIYLPEQTPKTDMPVLYWLSGPTCTEQNFTGKLAHSGMRRNMV